MKLIVFVFSIVVLIQPTTSYAFYCNEPTEPHKPFTRDEWTFNSYKREITQFAEDSNDYARCIAKEQQEKVDKAICEFNCFAEGQDFCSCY